MVILFVKSSMTELSAYSVLWFIAIWTLSHGMLFLFLSCGMLFPVGLYIGYIFYDKILFTFLHLLANSYSFFSVHHKCHFDQEAFKILHFSNHILLSLLYLPPLAD